MVKLVSSRSSEGYTSALMRSFGSLKLAPKKSSLSKYRKKISYKFFENALNKLIKKIDSNSIRFQGLRIYAVDGFEYILPRTADVLKNDFQGRRVQCLGEGYYPRMYIVHAYDVLSRCTKSFEWRNFIDEIDGALRLIPKFERKSLCIYDRLYICSRIMREHFKTKNFFLCRCRSGYTLKPIQDFFKSNKKRSSFVFEGGVVYLIKVKNKKTKEYDVFATNLPESWHSKKVIRRLYSLRWEVENSFRDLKESLKIQQWHSKTVNGLLQELYLKFWLMNFTRASMLEAEAKSKNALKLEYKKANFKLILEFPAYAHSCT